MLSKLKVSTKCHFFLVLWNVEATGHNTTYLPKVSSLSTSSSIVRSKSSKEGLPSGFYNSKSKRSGGFQNPFQTWFLTAQSQITARTSARCSLLSDGKMQASQMAQTFPAGTAARLTFLPHCFRVPVRDPNRAPDRLQHPVLLICSALYDLPPPRYPISFPTKPSHGLSAQSNQSPASRTHTMVITTSLPLLTLCSLPQHHFLTRRLCPSQWLLLGSVIASDREYGLSSQTGLCFSVATWPWASINFMSLGTLLQRGIIVKVSTPQRVILRTKSKALSIMPGTQYTLTNIIIIFQKSSWCLIASTKWHLNT